MASHSPASRILPLAKAARAILVRGDTLPPSISRTRSFSIASAPLQHPSEAASAPSAAAGAAPTSSSGKKEERRWSAILLFIPGLATFGLGTWQLLRRQWKVELLDYRRKRLEDEVVPLEQALYSASSLSSQGPSQQESQKDAVLSSLEFRRVECKGTYAEDKSLFLGPRGRSNYGVTERGYFLVTPLLPEQDESGSVQVPVLVNRGWVPGSWRDAFPTSTSEDKSISDASPELGKEKPIKGFWSFWWGKKQEVSEDVKPKVKTTKVIGVIRGSENPNMFVPSNEPRSGQWFYVDVPAMARAVNLPEDTIYMEALQEEADAGKVKDYPVPKDPDSLVRSSVMPQDHLSYAFTWYTLSAATTYMAWKRLQKKTLRRI